MPEIGQLMGAFATLDSAITLTASTNNQNGSAKDIGASTSPQAVTVSVQFFFDVGASENVDIDVRVQYSDDNFTTAPSAGQGDELGNFLESTTNTDLRTNIISFVPKARYFRFQYDENAGDAPEVTSDVALNTFQQL